MQSASRLPQKWMDDRSFRYCGDSGKTTVRWYSPNSIKQRPGEITLRDACRQNPLDISTTLGRNIGNGLIIRRLLPFFSVVGRLISDVILSFNFWEMACATPLIHTNNIVLRSNQCRTNQTSYLFLPTNSDRHPCRFLVNPRSRLPISIDWRPAA